MKITPMTPGVPGTNPGIVPPWLQWPITIQPWPLPPGTLPPLSVVPQPER